MESKLRILVTNDDGINAPGLWALVKALKEVGEVTVLAPDREQSGVGPSLSLAKPLRINTLPFRIDGVEVYSAEGTPGDCVILGLGFLMKERADLVVAGINQGHNTANEILISGTVGAALHARLRGVPAIAISLTLLTSTQHDIAARLVVLLAQRLALGELPKNVLLNINVPNAELEDIKGIMVTHLAHRAFADEVEEEKDKREKNQYWLVRKRKNIDLRKGTDLWAIFNKYISLTPLDDYLNCLPKATIPLSLCQELFEELRKSLP